MNTNNIIIWKKIISYYLEMGSYKSVNNILNKSCKLMDYNASKLWDLIPEHFKDIGNVNVV